MPDNSLDKTKRGRSTVENPRTPSPRSANLLGFKSIFYCDALVRSRKHPAELLDCLGRLAELLEDILSLTRRCIDANEHVGDFLQQKLDLAVLLACTDKQAYIL